MSTALPASEVRTPPAVPRPRWRGGWGAVFPASAGVVLRNYLSAAALLLLGYGFYAVSPVHREFFIPAGFAALTCGLGAYLLLLPLYYATFPDERAVKCRLFWQAVWAWRQRRLEPHEATAVRAVLVKAFFLPLMTNWLVMHILNVSEAWHAVGTTGETLHEWYTVLFGALIVVDVLFFTLGYAIEHPWLGNEIRSVEPTLLGWGAALICYYPFYHGMVRVLGWYAVDYPAFGNACVQVPVAAVMLTLLGIYVWASVALGLRASNLTNRGIVQSGPYAWVRHPAYAAKNLCWCLGAVPWLNTFGRQNPILALCGVLGLIGWCGLYALRAVTEERHLLRDPAYQEYCRRVPRRFIPGVW